MVNFVGISTMLLTLCLADSYYFQNYFASGRIILTNLFAKSSILGENIITSRDFSLATPKTIEYVNSYKSYNSIPTLSLPEFAFIGRSNVGKSSLLNTLSGTNKRIATAGKNPGTTRCINIYACKDKSGPICTFVDLPGYGFAKLSKTEQDEISRFLRDYFLARGALKLVFLLVDSRRERNLMDEDMFSVSGSFLHITTLYGQRSNKLIPPCLLQIFAVSRRPRGVSGSRSHKNGQVIK